MIPSKEHEQQCYEVFYDATSNTALQFETCPVCAQGKLASDGGRMTLLSNHSVRALLKNPLVRTDSENEMVILSEHLRGRDWMLDVR